MVKRRVADETSQKRASLDENERNGNNGAVNRNNTMRVNSGKAVSTCTDSNQNFIRTALSDNPQDKHDSQNQKKKGLKQNLQSKDKQTDEFQYKTERLISARINQELFCHMKESILSLSMLTNGLTEHVAQVRDQQKRADKLWNDLEKQLLRYGTAVKDERSKDFQKRVASKKARADTPATLMLPYINTVVKSESSRPNSSPSLFKDSDSPDERESEIFNKSKTNQIKKIARKRTKEKSTKAEDLFPMVTQDHGLPRLKFKSKRIDSASKKQVLPGEKAARDRIEKRLIALETFQDRYIVEAGKNQSITNMDKNGSQDKSETAPIQRQKKDGMKKMK